MSRLFIIEIVEWKIWTSVATLKFYILNIFWRIFFWFCIGGQRIPIEKLFLSSVSEKKMYTSKLGHPFNLSSPTVSLKRCANQKISFNCVSLKSHVSCSFLWDCSTRVTHFLVLESKSSSIPFCANAQTRIRSVYLEVNPQGPVEPKFLSIVA